MNSVATYIILFTFVAVVFSLRHFTLVYYNRCYEENININKRYLHDSNGTILKRNNNIKTKQTNKYTDNMCSHKLGKETTPAPRHATPIVKTSVFISMIFYLVVIFVVISLFMYLYVRSIYFTTIRLINCS